MGYAGGSAQNPTYYSLGGHSETVEIDYDPDVISYDELLQVFWDGHSPTAPSYSRQYASIIFVHDERQRALAEASLRQEAARRGQQIYTEIVPYDRFYLAEDYHQKYMLRQSPEFAEEYARIYPTTEQWIDSTAAARLNGYLVRYGTRDQVLADVGRLGLSEERQAELLERF